MSNKRMSEREFNQCFELLRLASSFPHALDESTAKAAQEAMASHIEDIKSKPLGD